MPSVISIMRLTVGVGLLCLGYYVGREVGRLESVREELRRAREARGDAGGPLVERRVHAATGH